MIKRTYLLTILLIVCLLTGCGNKTEKMCRIEIRNENSTDVITLEQQSQADVDDFFDEDEWTECENFDEKLLCNRVRQYFQRSKKPSAKIEQMVSHVSYFEYIVTDSEMEALILECNLIKKILMKKSWNIPHIRIQILLR